MRALILVAAGTALLTACGGSGGGVGKDSTTSSPAKVPDYSSLKTAKADDSGLRSPSSATEFEASLKNGLRLLLRDQSQPTIYTLGDPPAPSVDGDGAELSGSPGLGSTGNYSGTNVQVEGVDEGDLVKYDGRYLYIFKGGVYLEDSGTMSAPSIRIVETQPEQATAQAVAELNFSAENQSINELYLVSGESGTTAVATISQQWQAYSEEGIAADSLWIPTESTSLIELVNVENPAAPYISWSMKFDGNIEGSRKIGNTLYLVSRYYPAITNLNYYAVSDEEKISNEESIDNTPIEQLLPQYSINDGSEQPLVDPSDCLVPGSLTDQQGFLDVITVTALNLKTGEVLSSLCMNSPASGIYSSQQHLYVGATIYDDTYSVNPVTTIDPGVPTVAEAAEADPILIDPTPIEPMPIDGEDPFAPTYPDEYTVFHKIALNNGQIEYRASGKVTGSLGWDKPQFRMDEFNGDLRVVTTRNNGTTPEHKLSILREGAGQTLDMVAELPNPAQPAAIGKPGENIYAVRFYGARAFIVTFEQIDPLYALDLSNPLAPVIAGELQIPGYSSYLHPINDKWLLAIGHEVTERRTGGIKIELFDVSGDTPRSAGYASFGLSGSWSEAIYDHRALSFLTENDGDRLKLTVPINVADTPSSWDENYYEWSHTGLYLFQIDGINGDSAHLTEAGSIVAASRSDQQNYPAGYLGGRAALHDNAVFYVYDSRVWSSFWDSPVNAVGDQ